MRRAGFDFEESKFVRVDDSLTEEITQQNDVKFSWVGKVSLFSDPIYNMSRKLGN